MTGFYPKALNRNIPPGSNDPAITPRLAILHVAVSTGESLYDFFAHRSGGVESHFYVRFDGTVEQYRSIYFQADANLDANDYAVSIETAGMGAGEWTPQQIAAIQDLLVWLRDEAGIPLRKAQTPTGSGVGYHVMFGAPGPWTPVAKSCPGPARVRQFEDVLVPWLNATSAPKPEPVPAPEPKPKTKVQKARTKIAAALDLLKAVPKSRKGVWTQRRKIRDAARNLPKE